MRRIVILVLFLLAGCAYVHLLRVPEWTASLAVTLCAPVFELTAGHISPRTASLFLTGAQALIVLALLAGLTLAWRHAWSRAWTWAGLPDGVGVAVGNLLRQPSFWLAFCGVVLLCTIIAVTLFWTSVSDFLGGPLAPGDDASSTRTTPLEIIYKLSLIIGGATAFGLAAWRGWCHDVQTRTTAQGHITDRFIEAAKLLGSEQMASRLGGIFMLWRTGKDSKNADDKRAVLDMLCAFIREPTPDASCDGYSRTGGEDGSKSAPATHERATMRNDVRAAVTLLSKESTDAFPLPSGYRFDLTSAQLPGAILFQAKFITANMAETNLIGASLVGADFTAANLARTNFERARLTGAILRGAYLKKTKFNQANLEDADLTLAILAEADLSEAEMSEAKLVQATLTNANLARTNFTQADLMSAKLTRADLTAAILTKAVLTAANLVEATLINADLTEARLTFANLKRANLEGADLLEANLSQSDCRQADFREAFLTHVNLETTNLAQAQFVATDLTQSTLNEANLTRANLTSANLTETTFRRANLTAANLTTANLSRAYLCNTNLTNANFIGAFIYGDIDAAGRPSPIPFTREHCADAATIEGAIFTGDFSDWPRPETASDGTPPAPPAPPTSPATPPPGKD
ncbi:pentapeptide repeat-containing protein [Nitratidesulfovibrio sp.]|uniref:pentapeptide repeat-containing protein n=1 Tax=Nitratidesulfovibrio sp. TaxID=2802297 RepID=UPI0033423604